MTDIMTIEWLVKSLMVAEQYGKIWWKRNTWCAQNRDNTIGNDYLRVNIIMRVWGFRIPILLPFRTWSLRSNRGCGDLVGMWSTARRTESVATDMTRFSSYPITMTHFDIKSSQNCLTMRYIGRHAIFQWPYNTLDILDQGFSTLWGKFRLPHYFVHSRPFHYNTIKLFLT